MKVVAVVPARMGSQRFPGKPLHKIHGVPMIAHVGIRPTFCSAIDKVVIATCDDEIASYANSIGLESVMTSDSHERCTDRVAEAIEFLEKGAECDYDIVAMIQGDEPLVDPEALDRAIGLMVDDPELQVVNLVSKIANHGDFLSEDVVKVVLNRRKEALLFSRSPIPNTRKNAVPKNALKQLGVILFRRKFLSAFQDMPETLLEKQESIDMMRAIESGDRVVCLEVHCDSIGVDRVEDIKLAEDLLRKDLYFHKTIDYTRNFEKSDSK